jgi:hypothetical protein
MALIGKVPSRRFKNGRPGRAVHVGPLLSCDVRHGAVATPSTSDHEGELLQGDRCTWGSAKGATEGGSLQEAAPRLSRPHRATSWMLPFRKEAESLRQGKGVLSMRLRTG